MADDAHLTRIREDLELTLAEYFPGGTPVVSSEDAVSGQGGTVAPWQYVDGEDSNGIDGLTPTNRRVTVRGITIYYVATDEFVRCIDWLDAFVQLGYSLRPGRTVIAP